MKIPSFKPNTRLADQSPVQLLNTSDARRQGEAVATLGKSVQQFGGQIDDYFREKSRIDNALYAADLQNRAAITAQEAETYAKTAPDAARDGSNVQDLFGQRFDSLKDEVKGIEDREKRAIGLKVLTQVESSHRKKLITYQVQRHNDFVLEKSNDILNEMSFRVQTDPTQTAQVLAEFDSLSGQMPLEGENKKNFMQTGRRSIILSAMESYASKGDFDSAKGIISETSAGKLFSIEERKKFSKEMDDRKIKAIKDKYTIDQMERTKLKQEKADMQEKHEIELYKEITAAGAPLELQAVAEKADEYVARGLISPGVHRALRTEQTAISKDVSSDLRRDFVVQYYKGKTFDQIKSDVVAAMGDGRMTHQDGVGVLTSLSAQAKREKVDPAYKQKKALARDHIKTLVPATAKGAFGLAVHGQDEKSMINDINQRAFEYEQQGMDPLIAAKRAGAEVVGLQTFAQNPNHNVALVNKSVPDLLKYKAHIKAGVDRAKANGKWEGATRTKVLDELEQIDLRIKALQAEEEAKKILDITKPEEKK